MKDLELMKVYELDNEQLRLYQGGFVGALIVFLIGVGMGLIIYEGLTN